MSFRFIEMDRSMLDKQTQKVKKLEKAISITKDNVEKQNKTMLLKEEKNKLKEMTNLYNIEVFNKMKNDGGFEKLFGRNIAGFKMGDSSRI